MKMEVSVPNVATIGVSGPVQCGKSIVMLRLAQMLESEFGAVVILNDELQAEKDQTMPQTADWERKLVGGTIWVLAE